jgi:hypothetical protein
LKRLDRPLDPFFDCPRQYQSDDLGLNSVELELGDPLNGAAVTSTCGYSREL